MEIDNRGLIEDLLVFDKSGSIYYFVQVIQRRKDNPSLDRSEFQRGYWYITSLSDLDLHWPTIVKRCKDYNARAYISLCSRSLEKLCKYCLYEFSGRVLSGNYSRVYNIPQRVALSDNTLDKSGCYYWCIDIDTRDEVVLSGIVSYLSGLTKIHSTLLTPSGYHLIVSSFNLGRISSYLVNKSREDYSLPGGLDFTLRRQCNTILYSVTPEFPSKS